jgi:hypothetical protein
MSGELKPFPTYAFTLRRLGTENLLLLLEQQLLFKVEVVSD